MLLASAAALVHVLSAPHTAVSWRHLQEVNLVAPR